MPDAGPADYLDVAFGYEGGGCAVRADGTLTCWGDAGDPPAGTFVSITGGETWCALDAAGRATCWYGAEDGEGGPPEADNPPGRWLAVAAPCGVRPNGRLACWDGEDPESTSPSSLPAGRYAGLAADYGNAEGATCAIRWDGSLACPGLTFQVGSAYQRMRAQPPVGRFKDVAISENFACAIRMSGALACWGDVLRDRSGGPVVPNGRYVAVTPGEYGTDGMCAVRADGVLVCFGGDTGGLVVTRTGNGVDPLHHGETPAHATAVSGSCFLRDDGTIGCLGEGDGRPPAGTFTSLASGETVSCAVAQDERLVCWGSQEVEWGAAMEPDAPSSVLDTPAGRFASVSVGLGSNVCALRTDRTLACWDALPEGAGGTSGGPQPVIEPPSGEFAQVDIGEAGACAVRTDGTAVCWATEPSRLPAPPAVTFIAVSVGPQHACGIRTTGAVTCWWPSGDVPFQPAGSFAAIDDDCGIRTDGTLACWGVGMAEDEDGEDTVEVAPPAGTFISVSDHCAVRTVGDLVCWDWLGLTALNPSAKPISPRAWVATGPVTLRWTASGPLPVTSYDIALRRWTRAGGQPTRQVLTDTSKTSLRLPLQPGRTVCPSVVARDTAGTASAPVGWTCITFALDDTVLAVRSGPWARVGGEGLYGGSALRTTTRGARLSMTAHAARLAIVASTCPGCGMLKVLGQRISLDGPKADRVAFEVDLCPDRDCPEYPEPWSVDIRVTSSGKPVIIDGIAASNEWK